MMEDAVPGPSTDDHVSCMSILACIKYLLVLNFSPLLFPSTISLKTDLVDIHLFA